MLLVRLLGVGGLIPEVQKTKIFIPASRPRESSQSSGKESARLSSPNRLHSAPNGDAVATERPLKTAALSSSSEVNSEVSIVDGSVQTKTDAAPPLPVLVNGNGTTGHEEETVDESNDGVVAASSTEDDLMAANTTNGSALEEEDEQQQPEKHEENMINPAYDGSSEDCRMEDDDDDEEEAKSLERKLCEEMHNSEFQADMDLIEALEEETLQQETSGAAATTQLAPT